MNSYWGRIVRDRRKELRLTQADLAELSGVSDNTIKNVEAANCSVSLDVYEKILNALGYDLEVIDMQHDDTSNLALVG